MIAADIIKTPRLRLRRPEPSDLPAYAAYCASPRSAFVRGPFSPAESFDKFAAMLGHWQLRGFGRYTVTLQGRPIGHAGPLQTEEGNPPELTWTLWDGDAEGHGYATEAAKAVRDHFFDVLGWPLLVILVQPDNHGSMAIAERLGATLTTLPAPDWYPGCLTYHLTRGTM